MLQQLIANMGLILKFKPTCAYIRLSPCVCFIFQHGYWEICIFSCATALNMNCITVYSLLIVNIIIKQKHLNM